MQIKSLNTPLDDQSPLRWMLRIVAVAVALLLAAEFSQHLTAPPSHASPIWPGSGIALAVTLMYGRRILLGVFLGALLSECQLFSATVGVLGTNSHLLLAPGLALGGAVQALVGAELIRRVLGPRPELTRDGEILRFQLLAGPLACLVSATVGMLCLWSVGAVAVANLPLAWFTWWVGDTIGVIIFAPLALIVLRHHERLWRERIITVALPMAALLVAVMIFYAYANAKESQEQQLRFNEQVAALQDRLQREFHNYLDLLDSVNRFFQADEGVSREEFRVFVGAAVGQDASVQALEWIPRVRDSEREAFEQSLPGDGKIRRLNAAGDILVAGRQTEYFAIQFIEPPAANLRAFGFDVSSNPVAAQALFRARDTGAPAATSGLRLIQETQDETGVVVYSPVYQGAVRPDTLERRRESFVGVTAAVFRIQSLIRAALPDIDQGLIAIRLIDRTDAAQPRVLFQSHAGSFHNLPDGMQVVRVVDLAGRDWNLEYTATPEYLAANASWSVWVVLTGGLLVTALAGVGLLMLTGRTLRREDEVIERTAELRAEVEQRRDAETQLRLVLEGASLGFWDRDVATGQHRVNDRWLDMLGMERAELQDDTSDWTDRIHPDDKAKTLSLVEKRIREGSATHAVEFRMRHRDGHWVWIQSAGAVVSRDPVSGEPLRLCGIHQDITQRMEQQDQILHQAHFDILTDLPNRFLALDRLAQLLIDTRRSGECVAVLFLDLDDFKKINDSLGHETGDKLLQQAAARLQTAVRSGDTVGRLGGDEFIVLLGGLKGAADAQPVSETLLSRFNEAFRIDNRELMLTASIGIAVYPNDGDTPTELLRNADSAMYHSKNQGRNTYSYFTDDMNLGVSRRLQLEEQMHGALDRDEFHLCYQVKVDIGSGQIIGAEALLRWSNPALGLVSPLEFIPIAEQTGLIVPIGRFVLRQALEQAVHWGRRLQHGFSMAVNLSPRQFRDPRLLEFIQQSIQQTGIDAASLELEITEGVLMSGHAFIDENLAALSRLGVRLAMDDFGTGYSSLSYLRSYPFDVIKIDREFVSDVTEDAGDRELVSAAIAMAHGLGLQVVAEGVETAEQLAFLTAQSCDFGQGYLFGKPVSAEELEALLAADA